MATTKRKLTGESNIDIKLETISNRQDLKIPDCCQELWSDCPHMLQEPEKIVYNPI